MYGMYGMGEGGNICRQGVYNCVFLHRLRDAEEPFPLPFPLSLALVTPIIRRAVATTNRRPRRCRCRRPLPKAPTGVWCSRLNRTRTSACSWGSTQPSSRFRSRARSERREGSLGLCATRTHCHLRLTTLDASFMWSSSVDGKKSWLQRDRLPSLPLTTKLPSMPPKQLRMMCRPCR
jgi:hypothetical protein